MVNAIRQGIIDAIDNEFGLPICIDKIKQGVNEPCFLVTSLTNSENHILNSRHQRNIQFMVQYFPSSQEEYADECNDVSERLFDILDMITVKDGYMRHDGDMNAHTVDDVLNFEVTYRPMVFKIPKEQINEPMETLNSTIAVKE